MPMMQIQCVSCQKLHLCDPDDDHSTRRPERVRFIDLIRGKDQGCTGCRILCEVLPLLNDYGVGPYGDSRLYIRSTGPRLTVESIITLRDGSRQWMWIGEFELCKTDGKWRYQLFSKQVQSSDGHMLDESVPWSFIQDKIEIPPHQSLEPGSEKAYDLIASWYATCRLEHDVCNARRHTEGPKRLLYIGQDSMDSSDTIRLVECDVTAPPDFIALSHAWGPGKHRPLKTVKQNIEKHESGIETVVLSRTFRDAVAVGRRLGEKYLWIDSLCIVQDDDQDKAREIPRMQAIYEGAALTISAMSSRDGRGGCWIPRKRVFDLPLENGRSTRLAFHRPLELAFQHASFLSSQLDTDLDTQYPLSTRKWALQERVLSRRILHFTAQDLIWECRHNARCACGTVDILYPDHIQQNTFKVLSDEGTECFYVIFAWMELVIAFSHADLSDETDVFPALAGLASAFSKKGLGAYCAGLWEISLPVALCWYTRQVESEEATHSRPSEYVAPTWSWGSVQGALCFDALDNVDSDWDSFKRVSELLSVTCEIASQDEFGHVQAGSRLKIGTPVCVLPPGSVQATTISGLVGAEFRVDTLGDIPWERECFVALIFTKRPDDSQALVLVANDDRTYRRCGLVCLPDQTLNGFTERMEFDIV